MGWHSTLWDIPDTLALGFLRFVNYLVLMKEFFKIWLILSSFTLRGNEGFIFIIKIWGWRSLGADSQDLRLLFTLKESRSASLSLHFVYLIERGSYRICELGRTLWHSFHVLNKIRCDQTWLISKGLCKHGYLSCSDKSTSILCLTICKLNYLLRLLYYWTGWKSLSGFSTFWISSRSINHLNIWPTFHEFSFLRYRLQLITSLIDFILSLLRSLNHHLLWEQRSKWLRSLQIS